MWSRPVFSNPVNSLQMGFAGIAVGAAMVRSPLIFFILVCITVNFNINYTQSVQVFEEGMQTISKVAREVSFLANSLVCPTTHCFVDYFGLASIGPLLECRNSFLYRNACHVL